MSDAPIAYVEYAPDGTELHVYRASSLDHCDSALMYALHGVPGMPPPPFMQTIFQQGHDNERPIIDLLLADQKAMSFDGSQEAVEFRFANAIVRGHIDGKVKHGDHTHLLEVKKLRPDLWKQWCKVDDTETRWPKGDIWDHYAWQTSVYSHALGGLPMCFVCGHDSERDGSVTEIKYRWYANPLVPRTDIVKRLMHLEQLAAQGMPKGECVEDHYPCPYYTMHADKKAAKGVVVVNDAELEVALENLHVMQDRHKSITEMVQTAKDKVEEHLNRLGRGSDGEKTKAGRITVTKHVNEIAASTREYKAYTRNYVTLDRDGDGK